MFLESSRLLIILSRQPRREQDSASRKTSRAKLDLFIVKWSWQRYYSPANFDGVRPLSFSKVFSKNVHTKFRPASARGVIASRTNISKQTGERRGHSDAWLRPARLVRFLHRGAGTNFCFSPKRLIEKTFYKLQHFSDIGPIMRAGSGRSMTMGMEDLIRKIDGSRVRFR